MTGGLYESDALAWTERQAGLLRRLTAGERVNDAVDWPNVIEEIEALGRSELHGCSSLLRHAMAHLLKLHAWPGSWAAGQWREEASTFLVDAACTSHHPCGSGLTLRPFMPRRCVGQRPRRTSLDRHCICPMPVHSRWIPCCRARCQHSWSL